MWLELSGQGRDRRRDQTGKGCWTTKGIVGFCTLIWEATGDFEEEKWHDLDLILTEAERPNRILVQ